MIAKNIPLFHERFVMKRLYNIYAFNALLFIGKLSLPLSSPYTGFYFIHFYHKIISRFETFMAS